MSTRLALKDLEPGANFIARHIGPDAAETAAMLKTVGAKSVEDFIDKVVPKRIRAKRPLDLKKAMPERTALSYLRGAASRRRTTGCSSRILRPGRRRVGHRSRRNG